MLEFVHDWKFKFGKIHPKIELEIVPSFTTENVPEIVFTVDPETVPNFELKIVPNIVLVFRKLSWKLPLKQWLKHDNKFVVHKGPFILQPLF